MLDLTIWFWYVGGAFDISCRNVDDVWGTVLLRFIRLGKMIRCFRLWFRVWFWLWSALTLFLRGFLLLKNGWDELNAPALLDRLHNGLAARYMAYFLKLFVLFSILLLCSWSLWEFILNLDWALGVYFRAFEHIFWSCWFIRFLSSFSDYLAIFDLFIAPCPTDTEANNND